jgi:hypothetical protein
MFSSLEVKVLVLALLGIFCALMASLNGLMSAARRIYFPPFEVLGT